MASVNEIKKDQWMTNFYNLPWYRVGKVDEVKDLPQENKMIEVVLDGKDFAEVQKAHLFGFDLVETTIEFKTLIDPTPYETEKEIRMAEQKDLEGILSLTTQLFTDNDDFCNRFKNKKYFSRNQANEYYRQSAINGWNKKNVTMVYEDDEGLAAYYMMYKEDTTDSISCYKGAMCATHPRARGRGLHVKLQRASHDVINEPFYVINKTQLSNYKIIKNHIKENRQFSKIEYIMYKLEH